ncbi:PspC domain-containing protein [Pelomonas sp. SE-A7]|uniref:PspC domain-containing protein n=1 Tax=Pelomonas sp. SE-A7 TaxID=3054953 RepID=UPI00259CAF40|nr:PspC domain-containing protein [Pelomonas sp. SE-A7]MDM4768072.1 PspC domain-containing protein [Pelomonas sp. SE-A7]
MSVTRRANSPQTGADEAERAMEKRRLYKPQDRLFGGVCEGIANWLGWNVGTVRLLMVLLIASGTGTLIYFLFWAFMPEEPSKPFDVNDYKRS